MAELVNSAASFTYDNLIGGAEPALITKNLTVASGAGVLARGTVLGKITASGKFVKVNSASNDGSQTANCILAATVDATSADAVATVYVTGMFNIEALTFGGTDTYAAHADTLRDLGIYLTSEKGV